MHEVLTRLRASGDLAILIKGGAMSTTILAQLEIYEKFLFYKKRHTSSYAVTQISIICNISERSVWNAIKAMRDN